MTTIQPTPPPEQSIKSTLIAQYILLNEYLGRGGAITDHTSRASKFAENYLSQFKPDFLENNSQEVERIISTVINQITNPKHKLIFLTYTIHETLQAVGPYIDNINSFEKLCEFINTIKNTEDPNQLLREGFIPIIQALSKKMGEGFNDATINQLLDTCTYISTSLHNCSDLNTSIIHGLTPTVKALLSREITAQSALAKVLKAFFIIKNLRDAATKSENHISTLFEKGYRPLIEQYPSLVSANWNHIAQAATTSKIPIYIVLQSLAIVLKNVNEPIPNQADKQALNFSNAQVLTIANKIIEALNYFKGPNTHEFDKAVLSQYVLFADYYFGSCLAAAKTALSDDFQIEDIAKITISAHKIKNAYFVYSELAKNLSSAALEQFVRFNEILNTFKQRNQPYLSLECSQAELGTCAYNASIRSLLGALQTNFNVNIISECLDLVQMAANNHKINPLDFITYQFRPACDSLGIRATIDLIKDLNNKGFYDFSAITNWKLLKNDIESHNESTLNYAISELLKKINDGQAVEDTQLARLALRSIVKPPELDISLFTRRVRAICEQHWNGHPVQITMPDSGIETFIAGEFDLEFTATNALIDAFHIEQVSVLGAYPDLNDGCTHRSDTQIIRIRDKKTKLTLGKLQLIKMEIDETPVLVIAGIHHSDAFNAKVESCLYLYSSYLIKTMRLIASHNNMPLYLCVGTLFKDFVQSPGYLQSLTDIQLRNLITQLFDPACRLPAKMFTTQPPYPSHNILIEPTLFPPNIFLAQYIVSSAFKNSYPILAPDSTEHPFLLRIKLGKAYIMPTF